MTTMSTAKEAVIDSTPQTWVQVLSLGKWAPEDVVKSHDNRRVGSPRVV